jgi:phosphorylcholine metabolism protein LicD
MEQKIKIFSDEELKLRNDGLKIINHCMKELNIDFFLIMGVLLGAIREKNFIKWDWDVELGFMTDSIINRTNEIKETFEKKNFIYELVNDEYKNFKINLYYKKNKYTLWGLHHKGDWVQRAAYRFPQKYFDRFDKLDFRGETYNIPNNVEDLLVFIYGDWKVPQKSDIKTDYLNSGIFNKKPLKERIINKLKLK